MEACGPSLQNILHLDQTYGVGVSVWVNLSKNTSALSFSTTPRNNIFVEKITDPQSDLRTPGTRSLVSRFRTLSCTCT